MEQDAHDYGGELPTYNELAAQNSTNSRFGRWKSWVEKRAAERYAEETPEARQARRSRGWGAHVDAQSAETSFTSSPQTSQAPQTLPSSQALSSPRTLPLPSPQTLPTLPSIELTHMQTVLSNPHCKDANPKVLSPCPVTTGQSLPPSHLKLHTFGSRFLPHSELPILSCLPLFDDQKLLLGHTDGLTLLDMTPEPQLSELDSYGPRRRDIWHGEGVYQMVMLEHQQPVSSNTPIGVVLALVGAEPPDNSQEKENSEPVKTLRMYNLASLASLVRWTAAQKDSKPLDLGRRGSFHTQHKKHKSVSRGFMAFGTPTIASIQSSSRRRSTSPPLLPPKDWSRSSTPSSLNSSDRTDSSPWVLIEDDDIPWQWATDFVPLASPSSRLANQSVVSFELHKCADGGRVSARLAVVTKQNILLYEVMRNERAFRFVQEFYTPIPARTVTFVSQNPQESAKKASADTSRSVSLKSETPHRLSAPLPLGSSGTISWNGHLSLFVIFEKEAGLIKISDSSVGELLLWEEPGHSRSSSSTSSISSGTLKWSLHSPESALSSKDVKGSWAPPVEATLPLARASYHPFDSGTNNMSVCLLTRGKITHLVRSPLAMPIAAHAPLAVFAWSMRPSRVVPRICEHPRSGAPFLQVTALGSDGIEAQELDLAFLSPTKGKAREAPRVVVQAEVGPGGAGFLCVGGHWTEALRPALQRADSTSTVDSLQLLARREREAGFYAWTQYALNDWRVFWLGGDANDGETPP